jgi:predicted deacylase
MGGTTPSTGKAKIVKKRGSEDVVIGGIRVGLGEQRDIRLKISETYTGDTIAVPVRVIRGKLPGPRVFVTAGVHGDEVNGVGIVHDLMFGEPITLLRGTLVLVPVVNVFGFENHERYLPDRRDLNRSFPGNASGSLASRVAHTIMKEIIRPSDYGLDLHTAAFQRTNFPNVRADTSLREVKRIAYAFGCSLVVEGSGPDGSLRKEACKAGVPTVILEAGEPWKLEPSVLEIGLRGIRNVLKDLEMIPGEPIIPVLQVRIPRSEWLRAEVGGILRFHVAPGEVVSRGQPIATNFDLLGTNQNTLKSPADGIILGLTTMPAVKPGEPICHIAIPEDPFGTLRKNLAELPGRTLHLRASRDLATSIAITDPSLMSPDLTPMDDALEDVPPVINIKVPGKKKDTPRRPSNSTPPPSP